MFRTSIVAGLVLALAAACGSARVVNRTQYGGTIALQGDRGKAMEQAHQEMAAHCGPGNYQILSEGETVVGTDQVATQDTQYNRRSDSTVATSSTRDATEWRVVYQCGGAPAPAPAPVPAPAPAPAPGPAPAAPPY